MKTPLPNTYWVEPGLLLAGEHPDGGSERLTRERLAVLEAAGVRVYVDLTQAGEMPSYQELLPTGALYQNLPIPDHSVPAAAARMQEIQHVLAQTVANKVPAYVHCRAGIGRTGIAVGCYLREQGASPRAALLRLNKLWQQNARAARWPSIPETDEQEAYILGWKGKGPKPARPVPVVRAGVAVGAAHSAPASESTERYRGCLVGLAVGDAMGTALQFADGRYGWSDDTAMALCVGESLLACRGFDGRDQLERLREWALDPAAHGAAPGVTLRPAVQAVLTRAVWNRSAVLGSHDAAQADAALLAPCASAVLFAGGRIDLAILLAADSTRVIQQSQAAVDVCRMFAVMLSTALAGGTREQVLRSPAGIKGPSLRPELQHLGAAWLTRDAPRRSAPRGLAGALDRIARLFAAGHDFNAGLELLLDGRETDRDALGAAWGALAGAFHGEAGITQPERVAGVALVRNLAARLHDQGSQAHAPRA